MDQQNFIINCINDNIPFVFLKYGDGEYICASKNYNFLGFFIDKNCDQDTFTEKLSNKLIESYKYITTQNNIIIALTKMKIIDDYFSSLTENTENIKYSIYRQFYISNIFNKNIEIYKSIKNSSRKKIYIHNELLIKNKILLNIDHNIIIPLNNWFDTDYDKIFNNIKELINNDDNNFIILTSCGMSAKVLIPELHKIYPNCIYIDIGSFLDLICTKRNSRGLEANYIEQYNIFKNENLIPENWDDPKYDYIYPEAKYKLGVYVGNGGNVD